MGIILNLDTRKVKLNSDVFNVINNKLTQNMFSQLNCNHLFLIKNTTLHGNLAIYGLIHPLEPINYPCQIYC